MLCVCPLRKVVLTAGTLCLCNKTVANTTGGHIIAFQREIKIAVQLSHQEYAERNLETLYLAVSSLGGGFPRCGFSALKGNSDPCLQNDRGFINVLRAETITCSVCLFRYFYIISVLKLSWQFTARKLNEITI